MQTVNTGWRRPARFVQPPEPAPETGATELFAAARLAVKALRLRPGARFVLDQLVGCYGGETIGGRYLVWPANEFLMERTGLSERGVRYAIRSLLDDGVISSKESANGKRFAIRSKNGQIRDAYGLDLSPLLFRLDEFKERCEEIQDARELRRRHFDEITICRRDTMELINAMTDADDLQSEFDRLVSLTPRRDSFASPDASLASWRTLHEVTKERYDTACGGNNSRLIENNKDTPDQSCQTASKNGVAKLALSDLTAVCPDAMDYMEAPRTERDLVNGAGRLRGSVGVHESAWFEAIEKLGPVAAGATFFICLQHYEDDRKRKNAIRNFGGFFRAFVRRVADKQIDLVEEIRGMRRRRAH
ncbi:replication initiation protein RepC [Shinella zoogloeoides]|uniref:replication initiation protein RepC n=1 Tax=Shinella zoogloeoides TaxID=352475 RepID=UPI002740299E|nr:replication initiation protein RepC [Shinella zoogloeoides]WLR91033.1 replication initiation protein RepC [Shinella zoogloeoides]